MICPKYSSFLLATLPLFFAACTALAQAIVDPSFDTTAVTANEAPSATGPWEKNVQPAPFKGKWRPFGDVDLITNLGTLMPYKGAKMAIITTERNTPKFGKKAPSSLLLEQNNPFMTPGLMGVPGRHGWIGFVHKFAGNDGFWQLFANANSQGQANYGSCLKQDGVTLNPGDTVKFRFKFLTNRDPVGAGASLSDTGAFFIPNYFYAGAAYPDRIYQKVIVEIPDKVWLTTPNPTTGYKNETSWLPHTTKMNNTLPMGGQYSLAFAALEGRGPNAGSALLVDEIRIATAGITITPPTLQIDEGAQGDLFVELDTDPQGGTVTVTPSNPEFTFSPPTLTFNTSNWNTPKKLTLTQIDNAFKDPTPIRTATVNFAISAVPGGNPYNGLPNETHAVDIVDDETPGLRFKFTNTNLNVQEGTYNDSYQIKLQCAPTIGNTVTVSLFPDNQVSLDKSKLTFDSTNWNVFQKITVTAINDNLLEGDHLGQILHIVSSGDVAYNTLPNVLVEVNISDDPRKKGGEGSYDGCPGPGLTFPAGPGEGSFGFGGECAPAPQSSANVRRSPVLTAPFAANPGEFTVKNVSHRPNPDADDSSGGSVLLVAAAAGAMGLLVMLGKKLL